MVRERERKPNQHKVPECYLKGFAPLQGQRVLWRVGRESNGKWDFRPVPPNRAEVTPNFYSWKTISGEWDDSVDKDLERIENDGMKALRKIADEAKLVAREREYASVFIAALMMRSESILAHKLSFQGVAESRECAERIVKKHDAQFRRSLGETEFSAFVSDLSSREFGVRMDDGWHVRDLVKNLLPYALCINEMKWEVEKAPVNSFFVTSDNPVYVRKRTKLLTPELVGMMQSEMGAELCFPLTQSRFLIGRWLGELFPGRHEIAYRKVSRPRVDHLNERTVVCAFNSIYAREKSDLIADAVRKYQSFRISLPQIGLPEDQSTTSVLSRN